MCTEKLFKISILSITSLPREIGKLSIEQISSVKPAALLEVFVRVRKQEEGWDKWKHLPKELLKN